MAGDVEYCQVTTLADNNDPVLDTIIRKFALQNALMHNGKANTKAVLGKVLSERPELRDRVKELLNQIDIVVDAVNQQSESAIRDELEELAPELAHRQKQEKHIELPELPNIRTGQPVVMRFAPGPSGPLHIGHTRAIVLNDEYVKRYSGKFILRFEDTNPQNIESDAYDLIKDDLDWFEVKCHEVFKQSDRFDLYYKWAEELIKLGHAYVCTCPVEDWRTLKEQNQPCPDRDQPPDVHLERWEKMIEREYKPGEVSMIVKTDLDHPNPAVRDFVALRMIAEPHPNTKDRYYVYPTYNFSVVVDDHLMGMTHILRGKDHLNNTYRQRFVFDYLNWPIPEFIHYGWVKMPDKDKGTSDEIILKTTTIKEGIHSGKFKGWSDIRLGTLQAMAQRGIKPEAFRKYWLELGVKEVDVEFSWDNLFAFNKDIIDKQANRYFFVWSPVTLGITGVSELIGKAPLQPDDLGRGYRKTRLSIEPNAGADSIDVLVAKDDLEALGPGSKIRLKDLCNVELSNLDVTGRSLGKFIGNDLSILKEGAKIIHWVSSNDNIPTEIHKPDGQIIKGFCESGVINSLDKNIQFERFGFVRLGTKTDPLVGWFTHK